jgi:Bacterial regulatory helix-turn-helix protein, lysR family
MRFDLVDLRLFLFVVEAASITHGAERAGMALASASERIREMEQSLGAPLLDGIAAASAPRPPAQPMPLTRNWSFSSWSECGGSCRNTRTVLGRACDCSPTRPQPPSFFPRPWPRS